MKYTCLGCGKPGADFFLFMDNDLSYKYAHHHCVEAAVKKLSFVPSTVRRLVAPKEKT